MALALKSNPCPSCQNNRILLYDTTGAYDATTDPTGWGSPNAAIADVDTATLTLTGHDGTEYDPIDVLAVLPNTSDVPYVILPTSLAVGGVALTSTDPIPGGIWICDYQVTGISGSTPFNYRSRKFFLVDCEVACCVDEKMSAVDPLCGCTSGQAKKATQAFLALNAMNAALRCGKISQARSLYDRLVAICDNNCKNC